MPDVATMFAAVTLPVALTESAYNAPAIPAPPATLNAPVMVLVETVVFYATKSPDLIVPYAELVNTFPTSVPAA
jgi:hypothetical protein